MKKLIMLLIPLFFISCEKDEVEILAEPGSYRVEFHFQKHYEDLKGRSISFSFPDILVGPNYTPLSSQNWEEVDGIMKTVLFLETGDPYYNIVGLAFQSDNVYQEIEGQIKKLRLK